MKSSKIISTVVALAIATFVSAESKCSKKITDKGYKCCSDKCVSSYTDEDGDWAVENGQWCGCGGVNEEPVIETPTDAFVENPSDPIDLGSIEAVSICARKILDQGYQCCPYKCEVVYTDDAGTWGIHDNEWCGCNPDYYIPVDVPQEYKDMYEDFIRRYMEISSDDKEIEKKWLLDKSKIPYDLTAIDVMEVDIKQTYICFDPEIRVREYTEYGEKSYEMTIKMNLTKDGLVRDETNIEINEEQYNNMVKKQEGNTIYKTRYQLIVDHEIYAIDIFHGDLDGLAYMEVEFATKEESDAFKTPDWVIKDVTDDIRYKNGHLARYGIPDPQ